MALTVRLSAVSGSRPWLCFTGDKQSLATLGAVIGGDFGAALTRASVLIRANETITCTWSPTDGH
jgi:hypothetical protein